MLNALAFNSLSRVSSTIQSLYQLRMNKVHRFRPKVDLNLEVGPYLLKTVSTVDELKAALRLRYEIFHRELIGKTRETGIDVDEFDFLCDHLILQNTKTGELIGTFRLNCSDHSESFYAAREFNLERIMALPGTKIELGRACVRRDYRNGFTTSLLWRGVAEYMTATRSQFVFGCASVKTRSPREAALLYRHFFELGRMDARFFAPPTRPYTMVDLDLWIRYFRGPLTSAERAEVEELLPAACRTYLGAGAFIGGEPAWDDEFKCIDFLTILHREDLNRSLWKRYKKDSGASIDLLYS